MAEAGGGRVSIVVLGLIAEPLFEDGKAFYPRRVLKLLLKKLELVAAAVATEECVDSGFQL